jgi:succinyldiaminopimelate transaminase
MKLPDFPWDLLAPYAATARQYLGGAIDLSQGTPVDPTPDFIQQELIKASNSPGYPVTIGTPELRETARTWAIRNLGATGEFDLLPTIGSKELIALLPVLLQSKKVLYPKVAYPTYLVGANIFGSQAVAVDIDATQWPEADLTWINSPSNPTGRVHSEAELCAVIEYSRKTGSVIASDECYLAFPAKDVKPVSIMSLTGGDNTGILSVHSLSKRSNLAGYRGGLIIGDPQLIAQIREIRKHAGLMVPLPIQKAMVAALSEDSHVNEQAMRYRNRRNLLSPILESLGFTISHTEAGLYIWCTRNEDAWQSVKWFSERGIIVTPGTFYGEESAQYIRIAMTASDEKIKEVAQRISLS